MLSRQTDRSPSLPSQYSKYTQEDAAAAPYHHRPQGGTLKSKQAALGTHSSSSSSSLRNNYHAKQGHQPFSSPPRQLRDNDDAQVRLAYRCNYREDCEILPTHSPLVSTAPNFGVNSNSFDRWASVPSSTSFPKLHDSKAWSCTNASFRVEGSFGPDIDSCRPHFDVVMTSAAVLDDAYGESKVGEKMRANGVQSMYARAGMASIENNEKATASALCHHSLSTTASSGKYANLIPEQPPPQCSVSSQPFDASASEISTIILTRPVS